MRKTKYIFTFTFVLLVISSLFLTIETVATGSDLVGLQKQSDQLLSQQRELKSYLVSELSLSGLETKSIELGFVKPSNLLYIKDNESVASK